MHREQFDGFISLLLIYKLCSHLNRPVIPFSPPSLPTSRAAYALQEVHLLWTLVTCFLRNPLAADGVTKLMEFTPKQSQAIKALNKVLHKNNVEETYALHTRRDVLDSVYFLEHDAKTVVQPFRSILKVYLALLMLDRQNKERTYTPIFHFPPHLSKVQFSIRLAAFHILHQDLYELSRSADQNSSKWLK